MINKLRYKFEMNRAHIPVLQHKEILTTVNKFYRVKHTAISSRIFENVFV